MTYGLCAASSVWALRAGRMRGGFFGTEPMPHTGDTKGRTLGTGTTRRGTSMPREDHPDAARRRDTARHWVPMFVNGRGSAASRRGRPWVWALVVGLVAAAAVRLPGAAGDLRAAVTHLGGLRLAWLGAAVTAQSVSLASGAAAQCQLLAVGGARLRWPVVFGLVLASTGLAKVMPAGPVTGAAWQARQYRRRNASTPAGVWAVLAGGFTSIVVIVALLLAGTAVADVASLPLLACALGVLAAGAAALTCMPRRAQALSSWLSRRRRRSTTATQLAAATAGMSSQRARPGWAVGVLACTSAGLLAETAVLAACFELAGLPIPWRGLLAAYATGQLASRLVPLPGGLGGMEAGVLASLALTGTPAAGAAAAVLVYRVAGYWAIGAAGALTAAVLARQRVTTMPARPPLQTGGDGQP